MISKNIELTSGVCISIDDVQRGKKGRRKFGKCEFISNQLTCAIATDFSVQMFVNKKNTNTCEFYYEESECASLSSSSY